MPDAVVNLAYLVAAALFILGLKGLSRPGTAVRGNLLAATGMLIAIAVTLAERQIVRYEIILAGSVVGAILGTLLAVRVPMTAMPQMVAVLNGFGGGASALVAGAALVKASSDAAPSGQVMVATAAAGIIGGVTFWGSMVAFSKLQGLIFERPLLLPSRHVISALVAVVVVALGIWLVAAPADPRVFWALVVVSSLLGVLLVIPIGGADMPVVISLLNSYSGLAAAATGFVLNNNMLIIAGALVGAAGFILTTLMSRAMNRSLTNVLFGGFGAQAVQEATADSVYAGRVKSATAEEVAMLLGGARRVVIVPGYGMAVSQAQYAVRDLVQLLESRGVEVEFAIHPVAGRMPGHMNVLLAEADIPYDKLKEMDVVNPTFKQTDVALVIGANDVVNPQARNSTDPANPIAGMPILNVDQSRAVVVIKRSLSPGFAGIPNPLFAADNTLMLFRDAKQGILELASALKAV
ncbi:MAG: NAD(P)(+) transhydrogenase (Re/Si-specific) subunit beta [Chloroflexi bacterium]|nr:NAD(P)(+) transhydrogenase (Re/Si-specific) subunit beta [Chloroflexota bacterium]